MTALSALLVATAVSANHTTSVPCKWTLLNSLHDLEACLANQACVCAHLAPDKTFAPTRMLNMTHNLILVSGHRADRIDTRADPSVGAPDNGAVIDGSGVRDNVVVSVAPGVVVTLQGVVITNGHNGPNSYPEDCGGGIRSQGNLTMIHCTVSNSVGMAYGGGVANVQGHLNMTSCLLTHNAAGEGTGGGLYTEGGTVVLHNTTVTNNTANDGGGITSLSVVTLINSHVFGNSATGRMIDQEGQGGGIFNTCHMVEDPGNVLTLVNSSVFNNTAGIGGGISLFAGSASLRNTMVYGNHAQIDAGVRVHQYFHDGVRQTDTSLTLSDNSGIFDNTATSPAAC
eukprot:m.161061 g.161061  ORF g.161061 m.161061 type:complete len:341 (-) comp12029_c0_seq1:255-1277(-)